MPIKDPKYHKKYDATYYINNKNRILNKIKDKAKERKKWIDDLKSKAKCKYCGEGDPACLMFHHLDSSKKKFSVANGIRGASLEKIKKEIKKCIIICCNCHRKLHQYGKVK